MAFLSFIPERVIIPACFSSLSAGNCEHVVDSRLVICTGGPLVCEGPERRHGTLREGAAPGRARRPVLQHRAAGNILNSSVSQYS